MECSYGGIPPCTGKNQARPVFDQANLFSRSLLYPLSALLITSARAMSADKDASREQIRQE
jgi:hypothetical protein